jgi:hypothetical protein
MRNIGRLLGFEIDVDDLTDEEMDEVIMKTSITGEGNHETITLSNSKQVNIYVTLDNITFKTKKK